MPQNTKDSKNELLSKTSKTKNTNSKASKKTSKTKNTNLNKSKIKIKEKLNLNKKTVTTNKKNISSLKNVKSSTQKSKISTQNKIQEPSSAISKNLFSPEYYDLPYKYNQTVVKILAQTPTNLFVYWEISDDFRQSLKSKYGKYVFEITKPVLIVYNETMNYSFEVDINDFANSWYIHVNDSNCTYKIELGRRPIPINYSYMPNYNKTEEGPIIPVNTNYIHISSSNELEAPNNKILFNNQNKILFRNVKTDKIIERNIKDFPFFNVNNNFISMYELYNNLYKEEISNNSFNFTNPSSSNISSGTFSSKSE